ncbi:pilus assembly protein CpaE [Egibacter rhizosphaerae]|uniref:Pilus assembly protein CpaE n=1 Tax=Egibacter rhizosphaerae TaxID=1670831 RepID=A0A411YKS4_9ACTN|nr:pilus assembly protein CpaE [Egibacter rhizosphaerae]QBI21819.1 pilus assembly protein CpaE [Egibacter rhizosphaerae]
MSEFGYHAFDLSQWVVTDEGAIRGREPAGEPLLSVDLAQRLRDAGLPWRPITGDRFVVPDADLDEHTFLISPMSVDVAEAPAGQVITFGGAVEWGLDAIMLREVVWLPREAQLRAALGERFRMLERDGERFRVRFWVEGDETVVHPLAVEAYGLAVLRCLEQSPSED